MSLLFPFSQMPLGGNNRIRRINDVVDSFQPDGTITHSQNYLRYRIALNRWRSLSILMICLLMTLAARITWLQIVQYRQWEAAADGNRIYHEPILPQRGIIIDSHNTIIVSNDPIIRVGIIPAEIPKGPLFPVELRSISALVGMNDPDVASIINAHGLYTKQFVMIKDNITLTQAVAIEQASGEYPWIQLQVASARHYRYDDRTTSSLSHIVGFLGPQTQDERSYFRELHYLLDEEVGKTGLEKEFETDLHGTHGEIAREVDAFGQFRTIVNQINAQSGSTLRLTIDEQLQTTAEQALRRYGGEHVRGAVIVMDPSSGAIQALVSLPSFSSNEFGSPLSTERFEQISDSTATSFFPRAIAGRYPPGSTLKLVSSAAAIDEHLITPSTSVISTGGIHVGKWFFPDWKAGGHGRVDLKMALAQSVNTFFYLVAGGLPSIGPDDQAPYRQWNHEGLGPERLGSYAKKFGFGQMPAIDLPGQSSGFIPTPQWKEETKHQQWYIGDTYHFGIGQGDVLVTPLQIALMTSVFANGGTLYKPYIVGERITHHQSGDERILTKPSVVRDHIVSSYAINAVNQGLRLAVTAGSARRLSDLWFPVSGKTGTAQWNTTRKPHSWFTGFAPSNQPRVAITVLVEEGGEGSGPALSVAKEVLQWYFAHQQHS